MKTILSILLCVALVHATTAQAQTNDPPPVQPNNVLLAGLVITAAVLGVLLVIKVSSTLPSQHSPVTLVLEASCLDGIWTPVATNTVILNGQRPVDVFREQMTDDLVFYRARVLK
jgi:hypothetical protein